MSTEKPTNALRIILTLAGICLLAGFALGTAYIVTREQIAYQEEKEKQKALLELFEDKELSEDKFLETPEKDIPYWEAYENDEMYGYAIKGEEYGYSSTISFIAGVDTDMIIQGVVILSQNETPGLGSRIAEAPVSRYIFGKTIDVETKSPWFLEQFVGLSPLDPINVEQMPEWHTLEEEERQRIREENSVTTVTGATISSEAVADGIHETVKLFKSHHPEKGE